MKNHAPSEKGQVLVLIILGLVALFGFAALALDGGMVYSHRRMIQNAADSAAYAAAADLAQRVKNVNNTDWTCDDLRVDNINWVQAANEATTRAAENDFVIDGTTAVVSGAAPQKITYGMDDNNGIEFRCNEGANPSIDIHVRLTNSVQTSFMHFVNSGMVINTVDSVVRVQPRVILGDGAAIVALKDECGAFFEGKYHGGVTIKGSNSVHIKGGGIHSNACLRFLGGEGGGGGKKSSTSTPKSEIVITGGGITYDGSVTDPVQDNGSSTVSPAPKPAPDTEVDDSVNILSDKLRAACALLPAKSTTGKGTIQPGRYSSISVSNKDNLVLEPGLYCISGDFKVNGGDIYGNGVTIFMDTTAGSVSITGGPSVHLVAPIPGCELEKAGCGGGAYGGLLFLFLPDDDQGGGKVPLMTLGGNSSSVYQGTILAPYTQIELGGTSETLSTVGAQIIAETVVLHGNTTLSIVYDPDYSASLPSYMKLQQ